MNLVVGGGAVAIGGWIGGGIGLGYTALDVAGAFDGVPTAPHRSSAGVSDKTKVDFYNRKK